MRKIGFFEEDQGVHSMTRLMLFISMVHAMLISDAVLAVGLVTEKTTKIGGLVGSVVALFSGTTAIMATLKYLQKDKEIKQDERSNRESGENPEATSGGVGQ